MSSKIERKEYASMFGPTTGDKIRLGDTELFVEIEKDYNVYGEEAKFGGGKTIRDGMGQSARAGQANALDLVITNAVIIDPILGVVKGDIGIKDGKIVGVGKAGNPDTMNGVTDRLIIGVGTDVFSADGKIVTPAGIDTHVHFINPHQFHTALFSGVTTLIGGGAGPNTGSLATTCTPGPWNIHKMLEMAEGFPMNFGFTGRANCTTSMPLVEQIKAGALGLKLHEDWGTTPAAIRSALDVADEYDVQITIHTDTLNEAGYVESTRRAFGGRTIHTYHIEGAGGGHSPDVISLVGEPNVLPSSTTPTVPYTKNVMAEHMAMIAGCHHLDLKLKEDISFCESRIRNGSMAAEDVLHDMGAISMMSSDSQAMGRIAEVIVRTWQLADKMKKQRGQLPEAKGEDNDNFRVKRYIAKYTINPAITHGISDYLGSIEPGKMADLVVWEPKMFGAKPHTVFKAGFIAAAKMGDANASLTSPQPVIMQDMFGAYGRARNRISATFVSNAAYEDGIKEKLELDQLVLPVRNIRTLGKRCMIHNNLVPKMSVDPKTMIVSADGVPLKSETVQTLPLAQRYFLF